MLTAKAPVAPSSRICKKSVLFTDMMYIIRLYSVWLAYANESG